MDDNGIKAPGGSHTRRYSAFISYRHADNTQEGRRWAEWLHRGLERYVVPPDLIGTPNLRGDPIRDSLYPIFRDEDELPANADLATGIRAALEVSDHLIVLCSPRSAVSPWVRKEVREFKELGRSDRILAIIIAGEPNADDPAKARDGIMRDEECFCEELRFGTVREDGTLDWTIRTEPLAADLRSPGTRAEGFVTAEAYREFLTLNSSLTSDKIATRTEAYRQQLDHALIKVIAGLLGVPLGQLVDRDAAHRTALAEAEAAKQREIAERERQLAEQAQRSAKEAHCAKLATERTARRLAIAGAGALLLALLTGWFGWQALSQQLRAEVALVRGEKLIDYLVGDLHESLEAVGRSDFLQKTESKVHEYYEQAGSELATSNAATAFDQLGDLAMTRRDPDAAGKFYEKAAQLLRETKEDQNGCPVLYEKTVNAKNLAWVAIKRKAWDSARKEIDAAFAHNERLETKSSDPNDRQRANKLQAALNDLNGDLLRSEGKIDAAYAAYKRAVVMYDALMQQLERRLKDAEPEAMRVLRERSVALGKVGDLHAIAEPKRIEESEQAYRASLADRERLTSLDPRNMEFRADLTVSLNKLCQIEIFMQAWSEASNHIDRAIDIARKLSDFEPSNAVWVSNTILHIELRGDLYLAENRPEAAVIDYKEALQLEPAAETSTTTLCYRRAWLHNKLGEAMSVLHDTDGASAEFNEGIRLLRQIKEPSPSDGPQYLALQERIQGNINRIKNCL